MKEKINRKSEKWIENEIRLIVINYGGMTIKLIPTIVGLPDRLILWPGGIVEFVEAKSEGGRLSKMQRYIYRKIENLGFQITVISNEDQLIIWKNLNRANIN